MSPRLLDCPLLGLPHPMFDLGEGLLDRVEVWRVGRQVPEPGSARPDHLPDRRRLVGTEIVHHDDVARLQNRDELLRDIGAEALAVDRSVEDARGRDPVAAKRAEEGQRAPVAVRGQAAQPLASGSPAAKRRHVGLDPGLVDADQPTRVESALPAAPPLPPARNVGAGLLKRQQRFF